MKKMQAMIKERILRRRMGVKRKQAAFGIIIVFLAFLLIIKNGRVFNFIPEIDRSMSYGLLFVAVF